MNSVKPLTLPSGIMCMFRITFSAQTITAASLHTSSECNSKKDYYKILDVPSTATNSEIKSAYYKLTMQYHPDKNASVEAKKKFQEISEAYEVLGNFASRAQYDRITLARSKPQRSSGRTGGFGTRVQHTKMYAPPKYPKNMKIFDFDEWTKQHYGKMFEESQRRKKQSKARGNFNEYSSRNEFHDQNEINPLVFLILMTMFSTVIIIRLIHKHLWEIEHKKKKEPRD